MNAMTSLDKGRICALLCVGIGRALSGDHGAFWLIALSHVAKLLDVARMGGLASTYERKERLVESKFNTNRVTDLDYR